MDERLRYALTVTGIILLMALSALAGYMVRIG
jgi:hypothetical protein